MGDEIYAKTIEELNKKVAEKLSHCAERIEKPRAAQKSIERLADELRNVPKGD